MAYNTKAILKDVNSKPIPQFYNPVADIFNPLTGVDLGGGRYGSDNLMWGKTAGGLYIPVAVGTNGNLVTTVDSSALPAGAATAAKQDVIAGYIDTLETLLAAIKDTSGIKKITDALPAGTNVVGKVGIDQTSNGVQLTGSIATPRKYVIEILANAQSVTAAGVLTVNLGITSESEAWLSIDIDQQPWTLKGNYAYLSSGNLANVFYPVLDNGTITNYGYPARTLFVGQTPIGTISSIADAKQLILYTNTGTAKLTNSSANTATVTIKIIRVWR